MRKILMVFANAFPYGTWEPFLQRETEYYEDFDDVYIFSLSVRDEQAETRRILDPRIKVVPIRFRSKGLYAFRSIGLLLNSEFRKEIKGLISSRRFSLQRFVQAAVFFSRANYEAEQITSFIRKNVDLESNDEVVLYSYRFLYQPYLMSLVAKGVPNPRLLARAHRADLYEDVSPTGYLPYRSQSLDLLDHLSLISRHGYDYVTDAIPGYSQKLSLDYMGTEDRGFVTSLPPRQPLRIVTCSNVVPVKRLELVARALAKLDCSIKVEWTHYGDGAAMPSLREAVAIMPPNVSVDLKGATPNTQILEDYASGLYHVLVNVSSSEGLPVSIMEACSFGIPVIATNVGGTAEIVKDGVNGILLPSSLQERALTVALIRLARISDEGYERLRLNARGIWEETFDSEDNYRAFSAVLRELHHDSDSAA